MMVDRRPRCRLALDGEDTVATMTCLGIHRLCRPWNSGGVGWQKPSPTATTSALVGRGESQTKLPNSRHALPCAEANFLVDLCHAETNQSIRTSRNAKPKVSKKAIRSEDEAERRAWATVNKSSGGGKKSGSGRGKKENKGPAKKGGRKDGKASGRKKES
jgi:hypothetical protein